MAVDREKLVEKARTEYGVVNADQMSNEQLKAEMKLVDDQDPAKASAKKSEPKKEQKKEPKK